MDGACTRYRMHNYYEIMLYMDIQVSYIFLLLKYAFLQVS